MKRRNENFITFPVLFHMLEKVMCEAKLVKAVVRIQIQYIDKLIDYIK